jgi:hypothetical protein
MHYYVSCLRETLILATFDDFIEICILFFVCFIQCRNPGLINRENQNLIPNYKILRELVLFIPRRS